MHCRTLACQALGALAICLFVSLAADAQTLISHYEFEGNTDNSVAGGSSGTIVDFNPGNPASGLGAGAVGSGGLNLNFGDYMGITTAGEPNGAVLHDMTIAMWIKTAPGLTDGELGNIQIMGALNDADSTALLLGTNGVGNLQLFPRVSTGGFNRPRLEPGGDVFALERSWADGQWHHIAISMTNGATNGDAVGQWYIDGQPIDTGLSGGSGGIDTSLTFSPWEFELIIGGRNNRGAPDSFLPGGMMLDDIRVYSGALSASQVAALVPEPTSLVMLLAGSVGLLGVYRRKN